MSQVVQVVCVQSVLDLPPFPSLHTSLCLSILEHKLATLVLQVSTGYFVHWYPPKKLKYGKPRLGESMLM